MKSTIDLQRVVLVLVIAALFTIASIGFVNKYNRKQDLPVMPKADMHPNFQSWTGNDYPMKGVTYG